MPPPAEGFAARFVLGPALRSQPDRRLVTLVRQGYETAFEEIVRRYGKPLGRYAAAIVGSRSEDVIQDSFSKALLALRRDDAEIDLRPWLYRIVRNTALNELRDRPPSAEALAEAIAGGRSAAEEAERREELTDLMRRLRELPESQRAAILMRELEGLSHEEIAAALGLSGGAARQAIHRARQALRDGLGMLLPLPLVRAAIDHGGEAVAAGAGAGGAVAAGGAVSGGGAGLALKAGVVTAVLAGSVGTGVALRENRSQEEGRAGAVAGITTETPSSAAIAPTPLDELEEGVSIGLAAQAEDADGEREGEDREHDDGGPGGGGGGASGESGPASPDERGPGPRHHGGREREHGNRGPGGHGTGGPSGHGDDGLRQEGSGHGSGGPRSGPGPGDGRVRGERSGSEDNSGEGGGHDGRPPLEGEDEQRDHSGGGPGPSQPPPPPPPEEEPPEEEREGSSSGSEDSGEGSS